MTRGGVVDELSWPVFLGGFARPLGCFVSFIDRPLEAVVDVLSGFRSQTGTGAFSLTDRQPLHECLRDLDPMQASWTIESVIDCGKWTAYLNNGRYGGDPTAAAPVLAERLDARLVTARHMPRYGPGHAGTQLWLQGPQGPPPLRYVRTLAAVATDGRWSWYTSGEQQSWEQPERYDARRIRDRFDRGLLVDYLGALDIKVDHPTFFGQGRTLRSQVTWKSREESVAEFIAEHGW